MNGAIHVIHVTDAAQVLLYQSYIDPCHRCRTPAIAAVHPSMTDIPMTVARPAQSAPETVRDDVGQPRHMSVPARNMLTLTGIKPIVFYPTPPHHGQLQLSTSHLPAASGPHTRPLPQPTRWLRPSRRIPVPGGGRDQPKDNTKRPNSSPSFLHAQEPQTVLHLWQMGSSHGSRGGIGSPTIHLRA